MNELRNLSTRVAQLRVGQKFSSGTSTEHPELEDLPKRGFIPITIRNGQYQGYYIPNPKAARAKLVAGAQAGADQARGPHNGPSLELMVVPMNENDTMALDSHEFEAVFKKFQIDDVVRQHIFLCSYGFYYYPFAPDPPDSDSGGTPLPPPPQDAVQSFYFGCFLYSLSWSFDPRTMKTSAILILRTISIHMDGKLPLSVFETTLATYKSRLSNPFFLAFVSFVMLTHVLDHNLYSEVRELRRIERVTEHGPGKDGFKSHASLAAIMGGQQQQHHEVKGGDGGGGAGPTARAPPLPPTLERQDSLSPENQELIKQLKDVSSALATVSVHLGNLQRLVKLLEMMVRELEDEVFRGECCKWIHQEYINKCEEDIEFFLGFLPPLKRRVSNLEPSIEYAQGRTNSQFQVVFGLITHEDANANILIAEAARKDSAAMKTIALMTMLFLPGMFFSSLFAIPSLKWHDDSPGIVQREFWVYWAVTVPSTVIVLLAALIWHVWGTSITDVWTQITKTAIGGGSDSGSVAEGVEPKSQGQSSRVSVHEMEDLEKQA